MIWDSLWLVSNLEYNVSVLNISAKTIPWQQAVTCPFSGDNPSHLRRSLYSHKFYILFKRFWTRQPIVRDHRTSNMTPHHDPRPYCLYRAIHECWNLNLKDAWCPMTNAQNHLSIKCLKITHHISYVPGSLDPVLKTRQDSSSDYKIRLDLESIGSSLEIDWEIIWSGVEWSGPAIRPGLDNRHLIILTPHTCL